MKNKKAVRLQEIFAITEIWVYTNGLSFDLGKFEAIHSSKKYKLSNVLI